MRITALPRSTQVAPESAPALALGVQLILGKAGTWNPDKAFWPQVLPLRWKQKSYPYIQWEVGMFHMACSANKR